MGGIVAGQPARCRAGTDDAWRRRVWYAWLVDAAATDAGGRGRLPARRRGDADRAWIRGGRADRGHAAHARRDLAACRGAGVLRQRRTGRADQGSRDQRGKIQFLPHWKSPLCFAVNAAGIPLFRESTRSAITFAGWAA